MNQGKTTLKLATRQKLQMKPVDTIHLNYRNKEVKFIGPCVTQRLLGINLKRDLTSQEMRLFKEKFLPDLLEDVLT